MGLFGWTNPIFLKFQEWPVRTRAPHLVIVLWQSRSLLAFMDFRVKGPIILILAGRGGGGGGEGVGE